VRFKGVVTKKGKNRGDVIEYSPEEKIRVGLSLGLVEHKDFEDYLVNPVKVEIETMDSGKKGDLFKKMWQNNFYEARGRVEVARRHKERDRILRPQAFRFTIKVEDCLCVNGLPDLRTSELSLEPV
jgi:hypothetical protein